MSTRKLHPGATITPLTLALARKRCGWWISTDGMTARLSYGMARVVVENSGTADEPNYWLELTGDYGREHPRPLELHNRGQRDSATKAVSAAERAMKAVCGSFLHPDYPGEDRPTLVTDYPQYGEMRSADSRGTLVLS